MQKIGVFVCWCGSNIAGTVDVNAVSETLKNEPGVVFSTNYQRRITSGIFLHRLSKIFLLNSSDYVKRKGEKK